MPLQSKEEFCVKHNTKNCLISPRAITYHVLYAKCFLYTILVNVHDNPIIYGLS